MLIVMLIVIAVLRVIANSNSISNSIAQAPLGEARQAGLLGAPKLGCVKGGLGAKDNILYCNMI